MRTSRVIRAIGMAVILCIAGGGAAAKKKDKEEKDKPPKTRQYRIAHTFPYPPWDVAPLEGVSVDVLTAVCEANAPMECRLEVVPSEDCFDTDGEGHPVVGPALASGRIDGCLTWFRTAPREQLGAEFGHGYSLGSLPQLIAANDNNAFDALEAEGSLGFVTVGLFAGFFSDAPCLSTRYTDFSVALYSSDPAGRQTLIDDLLSGAIDLAFWDSTNTVPIEAHRVGSPIETCGPGELGLAVYPPSKSRKHQSDSLRRDYNCGLALIRADGTLEEICTTSPHPGGDPACTLEGPPPTVQCLADNPAEP